MIKILILLVVLFGYQAQINAQVIDTLKYLQSIVACKTQYIGKPFSVLLKDLKIPIKYFSPHASIHYAKDSETSTTLSFYFPRTADEIYLTYPSLEIVWKPYLNTSESLDLFTLYHSVGWNTIIANYYSTGIIYDIRIFE